MLPWTRTEKTQTPTTLEQKKGEGKGHRFISKNFFISDLADYPRVLEGRDTPLW